jgi:hypothetical protein
MKKLILSLNIFLLAAAQVSSQSTVSVKQTPTYHELKEAGLLGNYTIDQLSDLAREEVILHQLHSENYPPESTRSNDPTPTIQVTSPSFSITPVNPSICSGQSATLTASTISSSSSGLVVSDDWHSSVISLGFTFTFYGNNYTQCVIGTNGSITFNLANASNYHPWGIGVNQPTTNPGQLMNTINVPWEDLYNPAGGTTTYARMGSAPNRIFLLEYCNVPYFGCNSLLFSGQVILYESSNIIETHIWNKPSGCSWNSGHAVHSVHNSTGSVASVVTGRNASNSPWSATNEGMRWTWNPSTLNYDISSIAFAPLGFFNPSSVSWYNSSNTLIGTGSSYSTPTNLTAGTYVYHAQITMSNCMSSNITYVAYDTVLVTNALTAPTANNDTICLNATTTLTGSCGGNCLWYTSSVGGTPIGTGNYTTPSLTSTTTYYVGYSSGACTSPRTAVTVVIGPTLPAPTATTTSVCDATIAASISANCGGSCQWYTQSTGGTPVGGGSPFITTPPTTTYWVSTIDGNGCTSPRTQVVVNVGNLGVIANSSVDCPIGIQNLTSSYSGAAIVNVPVENDTLSDYAPDEAICTDPDNVDCPSSNYVTRTLLSPANVDNPMTLASVQSLYLKLYDFTLDPDNPVGADTKIWLRSPAGTLLLLTSTRPFNSDQSLNTCYCPTFTYIGSDGILPNAEGPYNLLNYTPEGGLLSFVGENPYATWGGNPPGTWTLYVNDNTGLGGQSVGFLQVEDFKIVFGTYPPVTYTWTSSGTCGTLSSSSISNPTYTPPSTTGNYTCNYTVTVTNGLCTGTASVNLGCFNTVPVELLSYSGRNTNKGNELQWSTASEINNSHFIIERFTEGAAASAFWKIPSQAINGNSTMVLRYTITDKDIKSGKYYYRLVQTDINGTSKDHGTIAIAVRGDKNFINIKPNPASSAIAITYDCLADENATLKMFDFGGNQVLTKEISCIQGENTFNLDLNTNADGIYLITIVTDNNVYKARFVKAQ